MFKQKQCERRHFYADLTFTTFQEVMNVVKRTEMKLQEGRRLLT